MRVFNFNRCRNYNVFIVGLVAHLTVFHSQSRQFPTVLLPGNVHSNKLISLLDRGAARTKTFFLGWKRKVNLTGKERNGGRWGGDKGSNI